MQEKNIAKSDTFFVEDVVLATDFFFFCILAFDGMWRLRANSNLNICMLYQK